MDKVIYEFHNLRVLGKRYMKIYNAEGEELELSYHNQKGKVLEVPDYLSITFSPVSKDYYLKVFSQPDESDSFFYILLGIDYPGMLDNEPDTIAVWRYEGIPDPFKKEETKKEEVKEEKKEEVKKEEIKSEIKEEKKEKPKSHKRKSSKKIKKNKVKKEVEKFYEEHPRKIKKDVEPEYIAGAVAGNVHEAKVENKKERKMKKYPPAKKVIEYYKDNPKELKGDTKPSEVAGAVLGEIKKDVKKKSKK